MCCVLLLWPVFHTAHLIKYNLSVLIFLSIFPKNDRNMNQMLTSLAITACFNSTSLGALFWAPCPHQRSSNSATTYTHSYTWTQACTHAEPSLFFWFLNFFFCGAASTIRFCSPYRFLLRTTKSNFSHTDRVTAVVASAAAAKSTIFSLSETQQRLPLQSIIFSFSLFHGTQIIGFAFRFYFSMLRLGKATSDPTFSFDFFFCYFLLSFLITLDCVSSFSCVNAFCYFSPIAPWTPKEQK